MTRQTRRWIATRSSPIASAIGFVTSAARLGLDAPPRAR